MPITFPTFNFTDPVDVDQFAIMTGTPTPVSQAIETGHRPGVNGNHFRFLGKVGNNFSIKTSRDALTATDARTFLELYLTRKGRSCIITDRRLINWQDMIIVDVSSQISAAKTINGGVEGNSGLWVVESVWSIMNNGVD